MTSAGSAIEDGWWLADMPVAVRRCNKIDSLKLALAAQVVDFTARPTS
jgi:hypothetical protein